MLKAIFSISLIISCNLLYGQDVEGKLNEAESQYKSEDLEGTRFALQQSLAELDILVGREILKILPTSLAGNSFVEENDEIVGNAAGITGVFVKRNYPGETKSVDIELVTDSPLLASLSTMLTNPLMAAAGGPNQKVVKIDSYKAVVRKDETDPKMYEVQIPLEQSLFTIRYNGFDSQGEVTSIAEQIGVREIANMLK